MSSELPDSPLKITIIGAGIAGLSAALALSNANPTHEITIVESNPSLSEFGAGIQLSANSVRLLDKWGMTQSLRAVAFEAAHMSARRWQDNTELASMPHNPVSTWLYGWPHWQIYRPDLQRVLYDRVAKLPNVRVLFGRAVTHVDHVTGTVRTADTVLEADLAVGADGIWSKTRHFLPATQDVRPTPYREHTYRSVIPRSRMLSNPITAPLMSAPESKAWLGPYTAVLGYTVASDSLYNFLISVPRPNPDVPLASWNEPGDLAMMRGLVDGWCEEVQALASLVQEGECAVWALGEVLAVPSYVSESGRVILIGDAAHAILPHAGQGGGMAIEDAASLAEFLGCMGSRDDLGRTMSAWSEFRQTRVEHLRKIARSNADALTFPDGPSQVARDAKWAAIIQVQQAQASELGVEGLKEKVIREKVAPDPAAKTLVEPGGAMWINGYDVCEESRRFCREHLGNQIKAFSA